ncbi:MAG: hypothetical protein U1E14_03225 [Geminicoccaceae bacterium]
MSEPIRATPAGRAARSSRVNLAGVAKATGDRATAMASYGKALTIATALAASGSLIAANARIGTT